MSLQSSIQQYIRDREQQKLEVFDKETSRLIKEHVADQQEVVKADRNKQRDEISEKYVVSVWLDDAARRASQIQLATHAPKYTNSDAKSSSFNTILKQEEDCYIGTHSLDHVVIDVTGNAAVLDVANFLLLKDDEGQPLWKQIADGKPAALEPFSENDQQLQGWVKGFSEAIASKTITSHALSKQIYFPLGDDQYHLLAPMFATSFCHEVHTIVTSARFDEKSVNARKCKRENTSSEHDVVSFPHLAEMSYGGSKPQNISLLNSQRRGIAPLLNSAPPHWESKFKLPVNGKNAFWRMYSFNTRSKVRGLNRFLDKVADYNNVAIRRKRAEMITQLVDEWVQLVATIRQLGKPGWSNESDLNLAEQCLLDPKRVDQEEDSQFMNLLSTGEWRSAVAEDFGLWVNQKLSRNKRQLGDAEQHLWGTELNNTLSRLRNNLEFL